MSALYVSHILLNQAVDQFWYKLAQNISFKAVYQDCPIDFKSVNNEHGLKLWVSGVLTYSQSNLVR